MRHRAPDPDVSTTELQTLRRGALNTAAELEAYKLAVAAVRRRCDQRPVSLLMRRKVLELLSDLP